MSIDTHLDATPSDITASAIKIENLKTSVDNSIDHLANARKDAGSLEGESATGAQNLINSAVKTCEGLVKDLTNYKNALDNLASELTSIGSSLAGIREQATAGGLTVSGELVLKPEFTEQQPSGDADNKTLKAYDERHNDYLAKNNLYNSLVTQTSDIRTRETEVRKAFTDSCNAVADRGWIATTKTTMMVINRAGNIKTLAEGFGLKASKANVSQKVTSYKSLASHSAKRGKHVKYNPKKMVTRRRAPKGWKDAWKNRKLERWSPAGGQEGSAGGKLVTAARKAAPTLKWVGRASNVASFAVSSYEQYQKDAQDPSLGEGKKATRAATTGTTTAVGGWAGGWAGAQVGATVGACVGGPAGAAIGGVVGGIAGGIAGSEGGKKFGGWVNSLFK